MRPKALFIFRFFFCCSFSISVCACVSFIDRAYGEKGLSISAYSSGRFCFCTTKWANMNYYYCLDRKYLLSNGTQKKLPLYLFLNSLFTIQSRICFVSATNSMETFQNRTHFFSGESKL